mmetsp:Transcript_3488/g.8874  ORF Transcript_3488/g.8874 Transcript_3488/m.8874 type:complete len:109 (-) Transcript_3488:80-406(-)
MSDLLDIQNNRCIMTPRCCSFTNLYTNHPHFLVFQDDKEESRYSPNSNNPQLVFVWGCHHSLIFLSHSALTLSKLSAHIKLLHQWRHSMLWINLCQPMDRSQSSSSII